MYNLGVVVNGLSFFLIYGKKVVMRVGISGSWEIPFRQKVFNVHAIDYCRLSVLR